MQTSRVYQPTELAVGMDLVLTAEATNHLIRVLRYPVGACIYVFNGAGGEFKATILRIEKNKTTVRLEEFYAEDHESTLTIHLGQGISRGEKMDFTIQKAVELGVTQITPLITERCNVKLPPDRWEKRVAHWRAIAIAACEQSGRNKLPEIMQPMSAKTWITTLVTDWKFVLDPAGQQKLSEITGKPGTVGILIGPEGGLDDNEITWAKQQNFISLKLGPRILRTETAAIAAITVMQSHFGDMG